jgi:hypothetical protein
VDLDEKKGHHGLRDFEELTGVPVDSFETPQAATPTGGRHVVVRMNGRPIKQFAGRIPGRPGVDTRVGGKGYIVLPGPGNGRTWVKPPSTPIADAFAWLPEERTHKGRPRQEFSGNTPYAAEALRRACRAIETAENGSQEHTLNGECFSIGTLVGAGELDYETALEALTRAAHRMPAHTTPWGDLAGKVRRAVEQGMTKPRIRPDGDADSAKRVKVSTGTSIVPQSVAWLWEGWLAFGKVHIVAGRPGSLKTTTALSLCATVTVSGQWPDGSAAPLGNVIVWSGEDAINDTLLPRFIAADGDRARVAFITGVEEGGKTRAFNPAEDIGALFDVCTKIGDVRLIVIDPIVAVAKGDSHKNAEARRDLQPLVDLAERTGAAALGVHHLTKRSEDADPLDRVSGSLAFGAGPRVVLLGAIDKQSLGQPRGVFMRAKNNLGAAHGGFEFSGRQQQLMNFPAITAQRIVWGAYVDETARDILARLEGKEERETDNRKIATFLREALGSGPRMAAAVIAQGEAAGFTERALRRALKKLGGHSQKLSFGAGWIWELPRGAA